MENMDIANDTSGTRLPSFEEQTEAERSSARDTDNRMNAPYVADIEDNELSDREVCSKIGLVKELGNNLKDVIKNFFLLLKNISLLLYSVSKIVASGIKFLLNIN